MKISVEGRELVIRLSQHEAHKFLRWSGIIRSEEFDNQVVSALGDLDIREALRPPDAGEDKHGTPGATEETNF